MISRRFSVLFILIALQSILSSSGSAQAPLNCIQTSSFWFTDPIPPGWTCGTGQGPFMLVCTGPAATCGGQAWCPTCNANVPVAASPINLTNGNTYIQQTDVSLPGLGGGLNLNRTWSSIWPASQGLSATGLFGPNWRSNFEEMVFTGGGGLQYARGDGSFWIFSSGSNANVVAPANVVATLNLTPAQGQTPAYWTITFQNGEQRVFNYSNGLLTAIIDRNGNATQLTYDGTSRLVTVTDAAGRHLYFGYPNGSNLVTSVTSDVGLTLTYAYDGQSRLSLITKPDLTTISFQYNANSLISAVLGSDGKVLEQHTYDSNGRGLTSSKALGVDAVTVTYQ